MNRVTGITVLWAFLGACLLSMWVGYCLVNRIKGVEDRLKALEDRAAERVGK